MEPTFDFRIKIAEVSARVRCRCAETVEFLRPYMDLAPEGEAPAAAPDAGAPDALSEAPFFTVEPGEEDLLRMREELIRTTEKEGHPQTQFSRAYLEQNAVHALLAEQLARRGVLLMHGSALCMDGQGYIFTAKSGTGKSTHARLWREVFGDRVWMINDDKPMLRVGPDGVTVWGTPWDGKHHLSRNAGAPLSAIVQIRRAPENRLTPMSKAEAFPLLMQQTYASADPATGLQILSLQRQILEKVRFYTMECNMEKEAAETAWEGMKQADQPEKE